MMNKLTNLSLALLVSGAALAFAGCAQDVEDINRVQNNVTQKSELQGEFYFRSTVVNAPYASFGFFVGDQNYHLERGVFDIQENTLYFYRTYEFAIGGETQGAAPDVDTPLYETNADGSIKMVDGKPVPVTYQKRIGGEMLTVQRFVYKGNPILAIPITSHFDIKRSYNPLTGEETNVIAEDTTDREWWQRSYFRVSWGQQRGIHHDGNIKPDSGGTYGQYAALPELMDEQFDDKEAPVKVFTDDGKLDYFDYKVRNTVSAPTAYLDGYGYIPACWYYPWYLGQVAECNSERVTFRHSFMRVKPSDYVAWDYNDTMLKKFGYYRIERAEHDPTRGVTYSGVTRRIRRFRIWENYAIDTGDACTTPGGDVYAECTDGKVCDQIGDGMFCVAADPNDRLDYTKMTPKPIVWYLSEQFPRDLIEETVGLAVGWNEPLVDVVNARKPGATIPAQGMFVLCENNLEEAAAAAALYGKDISNDADVAELQAQGKLAQIGGVCADMANAKRNGDLRYSQIHSVNEPISYPLYGYGPSSADPMTGELLSANSYMYTPAMKRGANNAMLLIELITGIRSFYETTYGNHVKERGTRTRLSAATGGLPNYTEESAAAAAKGMLDPAVAMQIDAVGPQKTDIDWASARMKKLANERPEIAKLFVTDDVKMLKRDPRLGMETGETTKETVDRLGIHKWGVQGGNAFTSQIERTRKRGLNGCQYLEEFTDSAVIGLAREYAKVMDKSVCEAAQAKDNTIYDFDQFAQLHGKCDKAGVEDPNNLWVCTNVTAENSDKGLYWADPCTVGKLKVQLANKLYDLNQMNQYWLSQDYYPADPVYTDTKHEAVQNSQQVMIDAIEQTRDELIVTIYKRLYKGVAEHEVGHSLGLRHNFEGSTDAMNFGWDYWDLKGDFDGNGAFHAHDFLSDENAEQRTKQIGDDTARVGIRQLQTSSVMDYTAKFTDRNSGVGFYDKAAIRFGYGGLVEVFNQDPKVQQFGDYLDDPGANDPNNNPTVHDFVSTDLELLFRRLHYTHIPELFGNIEGLYDRNLVSHTSIDELGKDSAGKFEVPYRFCSDELSHRTPTCATRDSGVDSFEIVRNYLADYENYWPMWGYWHDNVTYFPDQYYNRVAYMFGAVKMHMQWWVVERTRFNNDDWWEKRFGVPWHEDANGGRAGALAVIDGLNTLAATFGRPAPGRHGYYGAGDVFEPVPYQDNALYSNVTYVSPTNCDARPLYPAWDYSGHLPIPSQAGAIYERLVAYEALSDPSSYFLAVDQSVDIQKYLISYYSLYPGQVMNLFSAMLANKTDSWGWYMVRDADGDPSRCHRRVLVGKDAGAPVLEAGETGVWAFNPEPEYTFPTTRFRLPMLAGYYGLGLLTNHYDQSFVDVTRVYTEGKWFEIDPIAGADVRSFTDPLSGKTFTAVRPADYGDTIYPAFEMLDELESEFAGYSSLQELQENYNYSEYQFVLDKLELLQNMNAVYDN